MDKIDFQNTPYAHKRTPILKKKCQGYGKLNVHNKHKLQCYANTAQGVNGELE